MSSDDHGSLVLTPDMLADRLHVVPVADLAPWERDPYQYDVGAAHTYLGTFGQVTLPVVVDGKVYLGAELVEAERIDPQHGGSLAVLDLTDLDWPPEKIAAAVLGIHRAGQSATIDGATLLDLLEEVRKADERWLEGAGYDTDDMNAIYEQLQRDQEALDAMAGQGSGLADGVDADDVPDSAPAITQPGDVWIIGPHRVMCGDAFDASAVTTLLADERPAVLLMDPPYGMNLDTDYSKLTGSPRSKWRQGGQKHRPVIGDDAPFDAAPLAEMFNDVDEQFWFGADYYRRTLPGNDDDGSWLVWDKRDDATDSVIGAAFELVWSRQRHKRDVLRFLWCGFSGNDGEAAKRMHPTQKPSALLAEILTRWAPAGGGVLDLFAGSGSLLAAADRVGRASLLMEIDPRYVDVICKRAQLATGIKPVLESTGEAHDFTEGDD